MADIYNENSNTLVSGTSKADYIFNAIDLEDTYIENVTIKALAGNDTIYSSGDNITIIGGKGYDSININGKNNLIQYALGDNNDTVIGFNTDDTLQITKGSYTTTKSGNDFIVNVSTGKIILKNALADKSNSISIQDSLGNVVTYNDWKVWNGSITGNIKNNVTLAGSKKADTIRNSSGENVLITGKAGNDLITNSGDNVKITGNAGRDSIYNGGSDVTIDGGTGNDYISNGDYYSFSNVSINGGAGNDTINIDGGGEITDMLVLIKDVTINGGAGNDFISAENFVDSGYDMSINGGSGNDTISNGGSNVTIDGGKGKDIIYNSGSKVIIDAGAGNDYISNDGSDVTIDGGSGNDTISNDGYYSFSNVSINGGTGNDLISLSSFAEKNIIQYASGDGNDTIYGFNSDDILHITSGDYTAKVSDNDVIVTVGENQIILKDAVGEEISILSTKKYSNVAEIFEENNFVMTDNLSEIVKNNLSPTDYKVETQNFDNLTQNNNLITFAEK